MLLLSDITLTDKLGKKAYNYLYYILLAETKFESRNPKFETNSNYKNFNVQNRISAPAILVI